MTASQTTSLGAASLARRFLADPVGATAIEYALVATIVAVGIFASLQLTGTSIAGLFDQARDGLVAGND